jgi:hypothetical protein
MPDDSEREEILAEMAALARKLDPDPAAQVSAEIASLREAVDSLRQHLAIQGHGCCHHSCWHYYYPYYPNNFTVTTGTTYQAVGGPTTYGTGGAIT